MAEFPPNLDDGERWLPSDIFPDVEEVPSKFPRPHYPHSHDIKYMDELARGFAALTLLQPNSNIQLAPKPPSNAAPYLEQFHQPVRCRTNGSLPAGYYSFNGGLDDVGRGLHGPWTGTRPISHYQLITPVRSQVEGFLEARARVLQEQRNVLLVNRVFGNRFLPFHGTGDQYGVVVDSGGCGGGGYFREYGGTGVFLPRIASTTGIEARNRKSASNRQDTRVIPQRSSIRRVDVGKQEECLYQLPHEIGLPQDWTY